VTFGRAVAVLTVMGALAVGLLADSASAETTWSGVCTYSGYAQFWPYRKWTPQPSGYYTKGTGPCDGVLNGQPFHGTGTLEVYANMKQPMSCAIGGSTYGGPTYLIFLTSTSSPPPKPAASSTTQTQQQPKARKHRKKKRRHKARHKKRVHHAAASSTASSSSASAPAQDAQAAPTSDPSQTTTTPDPPQDPQSPPPPPAAPDPGSNPMIIAYSDEVNTSNKITSDLWGQYRGYAFGGGGFPDDPDALSRCAGDGVTGDPLTQKFRTITPLVG
jgi:hypothetical protein